MVETIAERLIEVVICLVAARPLARHLLTIRRSGGRPLQLFVAGVGIYVAVVAVLALRFPLALRGITGLALVVIASGLWRSRSGYGARRGLPPGSLAPAAPRMYRTQDYFLDEFAARGSIFKVAPALRKPNVCVVGHDIARELLKTSGPDLEVLPARYNKHIPKGFLRYMDEDDHRDYRRVFHAAVSSDLVGANEAPVRAIIAGDFTRWDRTKDGAPVRSEITKTMFAVMMQLFFGITIDDPRYSRLEVLYERVSAGDRQVEAALVEIETLLFDVGVRPGPESVHGRICGEASPGIEDPTIRRNLIYMVETAHRDVAGLFIWVVKLLDENRVWIDRLRDALAAPGHLALDSKGRSLADRAIMESLRLERSEYLIRKAKNELRIGRFVVPKGWIVRICIREAHRTNAVFENASEFDPDRFLNRTFDHTAYAPFGMVQRRCLGTEIVAALGRLFLEQLLGSYDFELASDGPPEFKAGHWQPNSAMRIRLVASTKAAAPG